MKQGFYIVLLFFVTVSARAQGGRLMKRIVERKLDKDAAENTGPVPDYSSLYYWAASPYKTDAADSVPVVLKKEMRDSAADVFFIHPTTYITASSKDVAPLDVLNGGGDRAALAASMKEAAWNANVDDTALNVLTDGRTILNQATVFNGSCRVFAPRYRQANLKAFIVRDSKESLEAFDLAYSDIKRAFEYYLKNDNHGRPIIIASHSQGSLHAKRLLQEFFDGTPLQKQLVCAYIVGYQIETNTFKNIPVCESPGATGCFVGWRSYQQGEEPKIVLLENGNSVCVNPLTWKTDTAWAASNQNKGSLMSMSALIPGLAGAGVTTGTKILWVSLPPTVPERFRQMKNLHILDYNLFWMNMRQNVKERVAAFVEGNH